MPNPAAQAPVPVTVLSLQPERVVLERELAGRALASEVAEVRPQVSGIVEKLLFAEGGTVQAGQMLYQIDQTAFRADLAQAQAALERARSVLEKARLEARRSTELVKINAVSRQHDDTVQAALRQAQAEVRQAQAAVQGAKVPLGFTRITAPISGRIGRSSVTQGALVTAGQAAPLATIQRMDPMYVQVSQSSAELLQLRRAMADGQLQNTDALPVEIVLEDGSVFAQQGRLSFAEASVDERTGAVMLRVIVPNPEQVLLPGMYVRARLANGERRDAMLVPQQAIQRDAKGQANAWVVETAADGEGGKGGEVAALRPVVLSRAIGNRWLVESGLQAGDRVILEGSQRLRPGAPVMAVEQGHGQPQPQQPGPQGQGGH